MTVLAGGTDGDARGNQEIKKDIKDLKDKVGQSFEDMKEYIKKLTPEIKEKANKGDIDDLKGLLERHLNLAEDMKQKVEEMEKELKDETMKKDDYHNLRTSLEEAVTSLQDQVSQILHSQDQTSTKMETDKEQTARSMQQLADYQKEQDQKWMDTGIIQQKLEQIIVQVQEAQERLQYSADQVKDAIKDQSTSTVASPIPIRLSQKFSQNLNVLKDNMKVTDVVNYLYQEGVLRDEDKAELAEINNPWKKVKCLVQMLNLNSSGFERLLEALEQTGQDDLMKILKK